jgi:cephalosporin-C deacetylase
MRRIPSAWSEVDVYEIEYDSLDGFRVGGWLTMPRHRPSKAWVVAGHGYGGRSEPEGGLSGLPITVLYPCGRGFHRSARSDYPNDAGRHVVYGIEHRDTYSHRGCVADLWAAGTVLETLYPEATGKLHYTGGSFGGGLGAMALAWDQRFTRGFLAVPSFGNHPLRVTLECVGSGAAIRKLYQRDRSIMEVLQYFDAASCARHIHVPMMVAAAGFDPAVPPPGQFAVYNALPGDKTLFELTAGHFEYPTRAAEDAACFQQKARWFGWL